MECKNCNAEVNGKYCNHCGQKVYTEEDKSVKKLFGEAVHFITHFEGKFFTTLKTLFLHPGKLSKDYSNGLRQKYYKPVSFYLLVVVLYLVFPLFSGLNMEMKYYKNIRFTGPYISGQIEKRIQQENLTEAQLAEKFHQKSQSTSKILLLLLIPFTVPLLWLLYFYKKRHLFDNFILATEINIFYVLAFYLLFPPLYLAIIRITNSPSYLTEGKISFLLSVIFIVYVSVLFRKVFMEKWWIALVKGFLFVCLHTAMLTIIYKTIVFEVTFALL
ncbi:MAG: DUF3667 domain-containing protein [Leadbetterella sp.]|nr:DUF3667 domain-containing protein [Leadbetterella sp.]